MMRWITRIMFAAAGTLLVSVGLPAFGVVSTSSTTRPSQPPHDVETKPVAASAKPHDKAPSPSNAAAKPSALIDLGDQYSTVGKFDRAIMAYHQALRRDGDNARLWVRLYDTRSMQAMAMLGDGDKPDVSKLPSGGIRLAIHEQMHAMRDLREAEKLSADDMGWYIGNSYGSAAFYLARKLLHAQHTTPREEAQRDDFARWLIRATLEQRWPRMVKLIHNSNTLAQAGNWLYYLSFETSAVSAAVQPYWQKQWRKALVQWVDRAASLAPISPEARNAGWQLNDAYKRLAKTTDHPWDKPNPLDQLDLPPKPRVEPSPDPADKLMSKEIEIPWTVSRLLVDLPRHSDDSPYQLIEDPMIVDGHLVFLLCKWWNSKKPLIVERVDVPLDHRADQPLAVQGTLKIKLSQSMPDVIQGPAVYCRGRYIVPTDQGLLLFPRRGKRKAVQLADKLPGPRVHALAVLNDQVYAAVASPHEHHVDHFVRIAPVSGEVHQLVTNLPPLADHMPPFGFSYVFADPTHHRLIFRPRLSLGWPRGSNYLRYYTYQPATDKWRQFGHSDKLPLLREPIANERKLFFDSDKATQTDPTHLMFGNKHGMFTWDLKTHRVKPVWVSPDDARLRSTLLHAGRLWFGPVHYGQMHYTGPDDHGKIHPPPLLFVKKMSPVPEHWVVVDDHTLILTGQYTAWLLRISNPHHGDDAAPSAQSPASDRPHPARRHAHVAARMSH